MRKLILLTITVLTFGCSNRDNTKVSNNDRLQKVLSDTTENIPDVLNENIIDVLNENVNYIGFIDKFYFSNENEIYIELYFNKNNITIDEYRKVEKLADSLIYEDDENSRHRFPASLSPNYFDLRGLSKLTIYDDNNEFVSNAEFVRVEFLDQNISACFIAVYKTDQNIKSDNNYGISNFDRSLESVSYLLSRDTILTQKILTEFNLPKPYSELEKNGIHIQFINSDTTISVVNSDTVANIVLISGEEFKVLYKSPESENFKDLRVVPLMKNDFPYLLTKNVKPDTDVMWDNLLYYDGTKYIKANRQRTE